jgi:hypothetical protein
MKTRTALIAIAMTTAILATASSAMADDVSTLSGIANDLQTRTTTNAGNLTRGIVDNAPPNATTDTIFTNITNISATILPGAIGEQVDVMGDTYDSVTAFEAVKQATILAGANQIQENTSRAFLPVIGGTLNRVCNNDTAVITSGPATACAQGSVVATALGVAAPVLAFVDQERASVGTTCDMVRDQFHLPTPSDTACGAIRDGLP